MADQFFDRIRAIEPTLRMEAPWQARFDIEGVEVRCVRKEEWLRLSACLTGQPLDLLCRQSGLRLPVRVADGPSLVVELPAGNDPASSFSRLCTALRAGLAGMAGGACDTSAASRSAPADTPLQELLEQTALEWFPGDGHFWTTLEDVKVKAETCVHGAVFGAEILPVSSAAAVSLTALADFVLAMNSRLQMVGGTIAGGRLGLESVVPWPDLTPPRVGQLAAAVASCASAVKRPCRALLVPQVAHEYLQFHNPSALADMISPALNLSIA
jgi:hypothetical protein